MQVGRTFSDILMCQAEPTGSVANVKDMYLAGGSVDPLFDSNVVSNIICISHFCASDVIMYYLICT